MEREMNSTHMRSAFVSAFTEWDRRYRENPDEFMSAVEHLLGHTPETYGEAAGAYMTGLLNELAAGKPWEQIGVQP